MRVKIKIKGNSCQGNSDRNILIKGILPYKNSDNWGQPFY